MDEDKILMVKNAVRKITYQDISKDNQNKRAELNELCGN